MSEHETETEAPAEEPVPEGEPEPDDAEEEEAAAEEEAQPEPSEDETALENEDRAKAFKKIDASFTTYRNAAERNLADEWPDWLYCPLCAAGSVPGFLNRHDLGRVPDEVTANVQTFLGFAREQDYPQDPGTSTCQTCQGTTKVKTGATAGEHMVRTCPICKGYGYTPPPGAAAPENGTAPDVAELVAANIAELETPDRDNWGEPRVLPDGTLNSNYGKMPQFKSVHPTYGVTAQLTPEELVTG